LPIDRASSGIFLAPNKIAIIATTISTCHIPGLIFSSFVILLRI
jgi:hypothetical protein